MAPSSKLQTFVCWEIETTAVGSSAQTCGYCNGRCGDELLSYLAASRLGDRLLHLFIYLFTLLIRPARRRINTSVCALIEKFVQDAGDVELSSLPLDPEAISKRFGAILMTKLK